MKLKRIKHFFWRANLKLNYWHEADKDINLLILYMSKTQVAKNV